MKVLGYIQDTDWEKMTAVWFYRGFLPLRELALKTDIEVAIVNGAEDDGRYGTFDVYHWPRHMMVNEGLSGFIDTIHAVGGQVVMDTDDDLTERYKLVSNRGDDWIQVIGMVDYLTVSTPALAKELAQFTRHPPVVLKNCVDVDWMQKRAGEGRRIVEGLTIGFSGSPTHWGDWRVAAVPLRRICQDFDVTPILHGEVPRYLKYVADEERLLHFGGVPFSSYPVLLSQFDVVLCAVDAGDKFNSGKSAIKALECMALGVVPICSRFGPYLDLHEAGAPVIIVAEDTQDGWYEAMRDVILEGYPAFLGPAWVKENRDMCHGGYRQWERFYREIA